MASHTFSYQLEQWLSDKKHPKTIGNLIAVFDEKSFAIIFLLLMIAPALPIPTGGVTHLFEVITMLVALELVIGKQQIWLPKRWLKRRLGHLSQAKALPFLMRRIRWLERFSHPRLRRLTTDRKFLMIVGAVVFIFALAAFLAPPFSGLDTLPSLGIVLIGLSLLLGDIVVFVVGLAIGLGGIGLNYWLGDLIYKHVRSWFK